MKYLSLLMVASVLALGACGGGDKTKDEKEATAVTEEVTDQITGAAATAADQATATVEEECENCPTGGQSRPIEETDPER